MVVSVGGGGVGVGFLGDFRSGFGEQHCCGLVLSFDSDYSVSGGVPWAVCAAFDCGRGAFRELLFCGCFCWAYL